ncbi:MAG: TonB-dependent receptor [Pseudomonadota bacterium]
MLRFSPSTLRSRVLKPAFGSLFGLMFVIESASVLARSTGDEWQGELYSFHITSESLLEALGEYTEITGRQVLVPDSDISQFQAPTLVGSYTAQNALRILVSETGFAVAAIDADTMRLTVPSPPTARSRQGRANIDEVIVYGTKYNKTLQETIESVEVVTAEDFDKQAVFSLRDVLLQVPNVSFNRDLTDVSIRGVSGRGIANAGTGRTINVYVDGAPVSGSGLTGAFNLWDVSQVEVLRGPQSTTQGRNALAGAIVVKTADPEYTFGGRARAIGAENDIYQLSGALTGPIMEDQLAYRLSADYREEDYGGFNAVTQQAVANTDASTLRGKLLLEPNAVPDLRMELNLSRTEFSSVGDVNQFFSPLRTDPEFADFDPFDRVIFSGTVADIDVDTDLYIAEIQYELNEIWNLYLNTTYEESKRLISIIGGEDEREDETFQADLRFQFLTTRLQGWVGGYWFDLDRDTKSDRITDPSTFGIITDPPGTVAITDNTQSIDIENYAIYGDVSFMVTEKVIVSAGARYDVEQLSDTGVQGTVTITNTPCTALIGRISLPCQNLIPVTMDEPLDTDYDAFLPRIQAQYQFADNQLFALSIARGYRAGGAVTVVDEIVEYDPEFLINYEAAYRSEWLEGKLTLNANVFFGDWEDQQIRVPLADGINTEVINAGESEFYGFEVSSSYGLGANLTAYASLGYVDTEYTNFPFAIDGEGNPLPLFGIDGEQLEGDTRFANLAGNSFAVAPEWTSNIGLSYDNSVGVFGSMNVVFRDSQHTDIENFDDEEVGSVWLVNGRVGWQNDMLRTSVFVDNLLDEEYFNSFSTIGVQREEDRATIGESQFINGRIGSPRTVGVELEFVF